MKSVKVKLAFDSQKPVNFKFGDVNVIVGVKPSAISQKYADLIIKQYPGWIELVVKKPAAKIKVTQKEV